MKPPFRLRTTNPNEPWHYFCNLGGFWGPGDTRRLIERTTSKFENGKEFSTPEEAKEILTLSDNLTNGRWQIVDAEQQVVK